MDTKLRPDELLKNPEFSKAHYIGFREVCETSTIRAARDGKPEANETWQSHGMMVEVLVQGQFGYAATPNLSLEAVTQATQKAYTQALLASKYKIHTFTPDQRPTLKTQYSTQSKRAFSEKSAGDLNTLLVSITERIKKSPKIIRATSFVQNVETEVCLRGSNGTEATQNFNFMSMDFEATAQEGSLVQKRSDGGMRGRSFQGGWEHLDTPDLWARVDQVADQAIELLSAIPCPSKKTSLVIMPDQMMLQIHESIGHALELDRILGDERNYAGCSFVKPSDFGTLQYGSQLMNITFDPTIGHEFASYAFDDNGVAAKKEFLIKEGKLLRGLGGLESQARSGLPGVANSRASMWNRAPIDRMANLNLEPGSSSFEEIIASIEHGVLMEANRSWSIDDFRNKFQFGCEYAKLIENGKITKTLRDPNYRAISVPFWNSLTHVGNAVTFGVYGTPNCGKGEPNQVIRVGHASPVCHFKNIEVFGGANS
ncbi:TldD/PmbA family protein, partial [Bdellovibrionota bacterium FG-2]